MRYRFRILLAVILIALLGAMLPIAALAQDSAQGDDGLLLRINGPVTVAENETIENVVVIGDNATIDGTVTGSLVVINGDAMVSGTVQDDITVFRGTLDLAATARVENVSIIRGEFARDPAASVTGAITEGDFRVNFWDWGVFWAFVWMGTTLTILVAGVIFAAVGSKQLKASGDTITSAPGPALLGVAAAWIAMPILMFMAFFTIIGIPLSVGYFLFVLPIFWFLGYLVAGTQLGRMILRSRYDEAHPYLAAMLGLLLLQIIGIIPFFGGLIAFLAGIIGSGALIVLGWRAWRGPEEAIVAAPEGTTTPRPAA
jgi:hypothetical protein